MASNDKHSILGTQARDKFVFYALIAICALSVVAEFFIHRHVDHPWEALPLFYGVFAFASIVILIVLSKLLRLLVMRKEDYYDR